VIERPRLLPAVILGAMGLLALKLLSWSSQPYPGRLAASPPVFAERGPSPAEPARAEPEVWGLAKIIAHAHQPDVFMDPETTGAIDAPAPKVTPEQEKQRAAEMAANPNNKAAVINGTERPMSPAERALAEKLTQRREEIEARMRELEMRERLLDTAEKKLDGRVDDLKSLEAKVERDGGGRTAADEAKAIRNLVIMYENMKPKDAARVFNRLALDVLVPVVQQMNPRKMSEVLAAMAPESAERLTIALAQGARTTMAAQPATTPLPAGELQAVEPPRTP
jgi:flagellar motility protein MotE (MotC chaperone)